MGQSSLDSFAAVRKRRQSSHNNNNFANCLDKINKIDQRKQTRKIKII